MRFYVFDLCLVDVELLVVRAPCFTLLRFRLRAHFCALRFFFRTSFVVRFLLLCFDTRVLNNCPTTPEELKVNKLQQLIKSGASHQHIRRALGLSARIVGQLFNTRVSKHNNKKKRTTKAVRKKKCKAQKHARKRNRNNVKNGARTTKSSTSPRHRSNT